jgi:hypothetical protein
VKLAIFWYIAQYVAKIIEHVKEAFVAVDLAVIVCDIMTTGVIITKPSSSLVNSWLSSESSLPISSALSITSVWPCSGVHIDALWLVVSCVCVHTIIVEKGIWTKTCD